MRRAVGTSETTVRFGEATIATRSRPRLPGAKGGGTAMQSTRRDGATGPVMVGLAASVVVHIAILAFLALGMRWPPPGPDAEAIEVSLVRSLAPEVGPRKSRPSTAHPPAHEPSTAANSPAVATLPFARPQATGPAERQAPADQFDTLRRALRASVGCDSPDAARLSPQEREACRRRMSAIGREAPSYAVEPADPVKAAAFDRAAAANQRRRREREGPQTDWPCVGLWCPPCKGASCPEPLSRTFAR